MEADFTKMLQKNFPEQTKEEFADQDMFTILPAVVQVSPDVEPLVKFLPRAVIPEVRLRLKDNEQFNDLGLKWYGIPMVSNIAFEIGGLKYTGVPFNGWYADSEIMRNLLDADRFNLSKKIVETCPPSFLDTFQGAPKPDLAAVMLNSALITSFKEERVTVAQHHQMLESFYKWYNQELNERGFCPGNWKWIIPPFFGSYDEGYMKLNKMIEYTLKPALVP